MKLGTLEFDFSQVNRKSCEIFGKLLDSFVSYLELFPFFREQKDKFQCIVHII